MHGNIELVFIFYWSECRDCNEAHRIAKEISQLHQLNIVIGFRADSIANDIHRMRKKQSIDLIHWRGGIPHTKRPQ